MAHNAVKNRIRLKICDLECTVSTEDQEDYVRRLGNDVQRTIQGLMGQNGRVSLAMAATIAALTYCDEVQKETANSDNLRTQLKQYCDEALQGKEEIERLQVENENLRNALDEARTQCSRLRMQLGAADSVQQARGKAQAEPPVPQPMPTLEIDEPVEEAGAAGLAGEIPQDEAEEAQPRQEQPRPEARAHAIPKPIPPLYRNTNEQPVQTGSYSRPKSPFEPDLPSADGFVSFFEKK